MARTSNRAIGTEIIMSFLNLLQPRSFIKVIIFMLWLLICIGNQVLSMYISPSYFTFETKCDIKACGELCVDKGFPRVDYGQPVPVMLHLCIGNDCYCSTQSDHVEYAWTRGRAITKFDCQVLIPAEEGEKYDYQTCFINCISFGYKQESIDQNDKNLPDTELIFNLIVNNDCCCGGKPGFTETFYQLPDDEGSESEEDYFLDDLGPEGDESTEEALSPEARSSNDDLVQQDPEPNDPTGWYPGKRMYEGEDCNPWRESSGNAAKRPKLDDDQDK